MPEQSADVIENATSSVASVSRGMNEYVLTVDGDAQANSELLLDLLDLGDIWFIGGIEKQTYQLLSETVCRPTEHTVAFLGFFKGGGGI